MEIHVVEQEQTPQATLQQEQVPLVRAILWGLLVLAVLAAPVSFLAPISLASGASIAAIVLLICPVALMALWLLGRGRFQAAVVLMIGGLLGVLILLTIIAGVQRGGALMFGFSLPIVLSGLLLSRRALLTVVLICCISNVLVLVIEIARPGLIGLPASNEPNLGGIAGGFVVIAVMLGMIVVRIAQVFHTTLAIADTRERELHALRDSLERTVEQRTAALQTALDEVEERTREQSRLYAEHMQHQLQLRQMSVPILPIAAHTLVVPLVGAMDAERLHTLSERTLQAIVATQARTVLLDITGVPVVDEAVAAGMAEVVQAARLLGAQMILVGVSPEVAQSIIHGGIDLVGLRSFASLQQALEQLPSQAR